MTDLVPQSTPSADDDQPIELEDAWRAAAAAGFDTDLPEASSEATDGEPVSCPVCDGAIDLGGSDDAERWRVVDPVGGRGDVDVVALRCPTCSAGLRVVLVASAGSPDDDQDGDPRLPPGPSTSDPSEVEWRHEAPEGATEDRPLGEDRQFFLDGEPGTLAEQADLTDADGDDIREYTGEPVETDEGWVIPQQQNVGPGNEAGGGEWPDSDRPSAMPSDGEAVR